MFKLNVLDHVRYHISAHGWHNFGQVDPNSDYYSDMKREKLAKLLDRNQCGEIVCYEDIPSSFLSGIWIHPSRKEELIEYLKSNQITSVNHIPTEEFVVCS